MNQTIITEKFSCLAWGKTYGSNPGAGIIAGGMQDGSLMLWDAAILLEQSEDTVDGLVGNVGLYEENQFSCLEWNLQKREWLATGGSNVYIADIEKSLEDPQIFCPSNKKETDLITSVSWNKSRGISHILASASASGVVNVWDLKVKRSTSSFRDKSSESNRDVKVSWNPSIPTQLAVVFDDPREPGIQIWDLRNAKAPVTTFKDVHKNSRVSSLSWSTKDPSLILAADRNNLVSCIDYRTSEVLVQQEVARDVMSVQWTNAISSVFIVNDIEGNLSFETTDHSILKKISTTQAPKWMKTQGGVAATLSTGLSFRESTGELSSIVVTSGAASELKTEISTIAHLLEGSDVSELIKHCSKKNQDLWAVVQIQPQPTEEQIYSALGFNADDIISKTEKLTGKSHRKKETRGRESSNRMNFEFTDMNEAQAEDFFNQLSGVENPQAESTHVGDFYSSEVNEQETTLLRNENWDAGLEDMIRRNLMIGNPHGAIDCAIKAGRYAHAFLIAYSRRDQPELLQAAAEGIALLNADPISDMLQSAIEGKVEDLIDSYDLNRWRELAAFIISNFSARREQLLALLADRLEAASMLNQALAVSLIQGSQDLLIKIVEANFQTKRGQALEQSLLTNFALLFVYKRLAQVDFDSGVIQKALLKFAHLLIEHEQPRLALTFLMELGDGDCEDVAFLKNCIYYSHESSLKLYIEPQEFSPKIKVTQPKSQPNPKSQATTAQTPSKQGQAGQKQPPRKIFSTSSIKNENYDDNQSLDSGMDLHEINERLPIGNKLKHLQPQVPANMSKKSGPEVIRQAPPPPPRLAPPPNPSRPGPPKPTTFAGKSTDEVVEHLSQTGQDAQAPKNLPPPPRTPNRPPGPPPPKVPAPIPPHVEPPKPAPVDRTPPPPPAPKIAPPKIAPPPLPATPALPPQPVAPKQGPPPPTRPAPPVPPAPQRPSPPAPAPHMPPPPPTPPKQTPPPPTPPKVPAPHPNTTPVAPPIAPARPVPPPAPHKTAPPPPRPAPPSPAPPKATPSSNRPAPQAPPKQAAPAPKAPEPEEEPSEQENALNGISQSIEFLESVVEAQELTQHRSALTALTRDVQSSKLKPKVLTTLVAFFDHMANEDYKAAGAALSELKKSTTPNDRHWIKAIETVLSHC